jgi:DNA-binding response OmpR family regulator
VLVIDDDETTLDSFAHSLRLDGFRVLTACTAEADSRS